MPPSDNNKNTRHTHPRRSAKHATRAGQLKGGGRQRGGRYGRMGRRRRERREEENCRPLSTVVEERREWTKLYIRKETAAGAAGGPTLRSSFRPIGNVKQDVKSCVKNSAQIYHNTSPIHKEPQPLPQHVSRCPRHIIPAFSPLRAASYTTFRQLYRRRGNKNNGPTKDRTRADYRERNDWGETWGPLLCTRNESSAEVRAAWCSRWHRGSRETREKNRSAVRRRVLLKDGGTAMRRRRGPASRSITRAVR
jgi:hypothetical protein